MAVLMVGDGDDEAATSAHVLRCFLRLQIRGEELRRPQSLIQLEVKFDSQ